MLLTQPLRLVGALGLATALRDQYSLGALDADALVDAVLPGLHPDVRAVDRDRDVCLHLVADAALTATASYGPPVLLVVITLTSRYAAEALARALRARGAEVGHVDLGVSPPALLAQVRHEWRNQPGAVADARRQVRASADLRPHHRLDATTRAPADLSAELARVLVAWGWLAGPGTPRGRHGARGCR